MIKKIILISEYNYSNYSHFFQKNKGEQKMKKIYMKPETEEMKISFQNALMDASQPGAKIDDNQDPIDPGTIESNSGSLWGDEE